MFLLSFCSEHPFLISVCARPCSYVPDLCFVVFYIASDLVCLVQECLSHRPFLICWWFLKGDDLIQSLDIGLYTCLFNTVSQASSHPHVSTTVSKHWVCHHTFFDRCEFDVSAYTVHVLIKFSSASCLGECVIFVVSDVIYANTDCGFVGVCLNGSMYRVATVWKTGEAIVVPYFCLYNLPLYTKYIIRRVQTESQQLQDFFLTQWCFFVPVC